MASILSRPQCVNSLIGWHALPSAAITGVLITHIHQSKSEIMLEDPCSITYNLSWIIQSNQDPRYLERFWYANISHDDCNRCGSFHRDACLRGQHYVPDWTTEWFYFRIIMALLSVDEVNIRWFIVIPNGLWFNLLMWSVSIYQTESLFTKRTDVSPEVSKSRYWVL